METQTLIRLVVGLGMTAIVGLFALRRVGWLVKLTLSGQQVSGRTDDIGTRIWTQIAEVLGQRRLLKWSIPGVAHFFTMWGFIILLTVYIEAYGLLFQPNFHIPIIGRWDALGFLQDFFATAVFRASPRSRSSGCARAARGRSAAQSRFYGSHRGGAWLDPVHDLQRHLDIRPLPRVRRSIPATSPTARERSSHMPWVPCCIRWVAPETRHSRPSL